VTKREGATPFDATRLPDVRLNHRGDRCTLEAILEDFKLAHPALQRMIRSFVRPTSRVRNMLRQRELAPALSRRGFAAARYPGRGTTPPCTTRCMLMLVSRGTKRSSLRRDAVLNT
jgi:ChrB, C-terminal domain